MTRRSGGRLVRPVTLKRVTGGPCMGDGAGCRTDRPAVGPLPWSRHRGSPRPRLPRQLAHRGMVTAELAIGLLVAAVVATGAAFVVSLVAVQTRCGDTASAVARQLARGDAQAAEQARAGAPRGARVEVQHTSTAVQVRVEVDESLGHFGPFRLSGSAQAVLEPGVQP